MNLVLAAIIGLLFTAGVYMLLRRSFVKLIIGLGFLGHAANLLIITAPGLFDSEADGRGSPPLIPAGQKILGPDAADPVPPALVLTAIVISFAVVSYMIVLIKRTYREVGTDDLDAMTTTDR